MDEKWRTKIKNKKESSKIVDEIWRTKRQNKDEKKVPKAWMKYGVLKDKIQAKRESKMWTRNGVKSS